MTDTPATLTYKTAMTAKYYLDRASESAEVAYWMETKDDHQRHLDYFMKWFRQASDAIGYDLVARVPAQAAHEAALEARKAEDGPGPDAPFTTAWDGRANSGGRMDLASIGECPGEIARAALAKAGAP